MDSSRSNRIPQAINAFHQQILGKISNLISNKVVQMKHPEKATFCQIGKDKRQKRAKVCPDVPRTTKPHSSKAPVPNPLGVAHQISPWRFMATAELQL